MKDVELRRVRSALLWLVGGAAASATLGCVALFAFFEGGRSLPEMLACAGALGLAVAAADFAGRQFKTMLELAETCVAQKQHIESVAASFDAALANMPHGVALYDSEQRVLLANRRYAEMYGLQPGDIKPGMTMKEILELRAARGVYLGDDATRYVDGRVSAMATPRSEHDIERYANGRIIEKSRKPIPGGGRSRPRARSPSRRPAPACGTFR
jgi:PAS domain-containing protein